MIIYDDTFADDPLAEAVYQWVADCGSAVEAGHCDELISRFDDLAVPAPVLYRGVALTAIPGGVSYHQPWVSATTRRDYGESWARPFLFEIHGATGIDLVALRDNHPGFVEPATHEDTMRLWFNDNDLYDRVGYEHEWLIRGVFTVTAVTGHLARLEII